MDFPSEDVPEVDLSLSRDAFQIIMSRNCGHQCITRLGIGIKKF